MLLQKVVLLRKASKSNHALHLSDPSTMEKNFGERDKNVQRGQTELAQKKMPNHKLKPNRQTGSPTHVIGAQNA